MTFGIFTSFDSYFRPVADLTMPVLRAYCDRHGYSLTVMQNPPIKRTLVWDRVLLMLDNVDKFDWTVWIDADILITNHNIALEEIVAKFPNGKMILARDHSGLNDGMIFNKARQVWIDLWKMDDENSSLAATWRYIDENPGQTVIGEVPQKLLHSYPYAEYGIDYPEGTWEPGDFSYHLPGMVNSRRIELFKSMLPKIQW